MDIDLLDPAVLIARLEESVSGLRSVKGAADFAAAAVDGVKQLPAAFVIPLSDSAGAQVLATMATEQNLAMSFGVIMVVQNLRDARGEKALSDITALRKLVLGALYGWQPAAGYDPFEKGPGRVLQLDNLTLWWQDDFVTRNIIRSA